MTVYLQNEMNIKKQTLKSAGFGRPVFGSRTMNPPQETTCFATKQIRLPNLKRICRR